METTPIAALVRRLSAAASRRSLLAGLTGGLLATGSSLGDEDAEARKKGKGKKKRNKKKRKNTKQITRADATCASVNAIKFPAEGLVRLAQTFTAQSSGSLVSAQLELNNGAGSLGDYILRLSPVDSAGTPTDEVLATAFVPNGDVSDGTSTVTFTFANPATVVAGTQYALVLTRSSNGVYSWMTRTGDPCVGQRFFSLGPTAPFQVSLGNDMVYTTFVRS